MTLELLPKRGNSLRCRHCHLTIEQNDLPDRYCPECFEVTGRKRFDFDDLAAVDDEIARYRCEECGAIVQSA